MLKLIHLHKKYQASIVNSTRDIYVPIEQMRIKQTNLHQKRIRSFTFLPFVVNIFTEQMLIDRGNLPRKKHVYITTCLKTNTIQISGSKKPLLCFMQSQNQSPVQAPGFSLLTFQSCVTQLNEIFLANLCLKKKKLSKRLY